MDDHHDSHEHDTSLVCQYFESYSNQNIWVLAFITCTIIVATSLVGILLLHPISKTRFKKYVELFFLAFAVGVLLTDATGHLIPHALEKVTHDQQALLGIFVVLGMVLITLFETVVHVFLNTECAHQHSPLSIPATSSSPTRSRKSISHTSESHAHIDVHQPNKKSTGYTNLFSEAFHNFSDGISIGLSFRMSVTLGFATSFAIFVHELPQEFSDFVVLIHSGFSPAKALFFNFLAALPVFAGCALALSGWFADAEKWLLGITAGGFISLALLVIYPSLRHKLREETEEYSRIVEIKSEERKSSLVQISSTNASPMFNTSPISPALSHPARYQRRKKGEDSIAHVPSRSPMVTTQPKWMERRKGLINSAMLYLFSILSFALGIVSVYGVSSLEGLCGGHQHGHDSHSHHDHIHGDVHVHSH